MNHWCTAGFAALSLVLCQDSNAQVKDVRAQPAQVDIVRVALAEFPSRLKRSPKFDEMLAQLKAGNIAGANRTWAEVLGEYAKSPGVNLTSLDVEDAVNLMMQLVAQDASEDMKAMLKAFQALNSTKNGLRREILAARAEVAEKRPWPRTVRVSLATRSSDGKWDGVERAESRPVDRKGAEAQIARLDELVKQAERDEQAQAQRLQDYMQRKPEIRSKLSSISEQFHETAKATLKKKD